MPIKTDIAQQWQGYLATRDINEQCEPYEDNLATDKPIWEMTDGFAIVCDLESALRYLDSLTDCPLNAD